MKLRRTRITSGIVALALVVSVPLATAALAEGNVAASITGDPVPPGEEVTLTFTIAPEDAEVTLASFSLTPPANWQLVSDGDSPSPGAPDYTIDGNTLVGSGLSATSEEPATVDFQVKTGCKDGDWDWTLVAQDSESNEFGNGESDLTTEVDGDCTLAIGTQPKDAAKNTLVTGTAFDNASNFVTVALKNGLTQTVEYFPVDVTFDLATGTGLASGGLSAATQTTVDGVATFSDPRPRSRSRARTSHSSPTTSSNRGRWGRTRISQERTRQASTSGGTGCKGNGCNVNLAPGTSSDAYTTSENVGMGASLLGAGGPATRTSLAPPSRSSSPPTSSSTRRPAPARCSW